MAADRPSQGEKRAESCGHTERCKPITGVDPVTMAQGDDRKDDKQLRRDDRLHKGQTSHAQRRHLKDEAKDHAGNPQEPYGAMEQVVDEVEPEAVLSRCRRRSTTLGNRGQRSEHTRRQSKRHYLRVHGRTSR